MSVDMPSKSGLICANMNHLIPKSCDLHLEINFPNKPDPCKNVQNMFQNTNNSIQENFTQVHCTIWQPQHSLCTMRQANSILSPGNISMKPDPRWFYLSCHNYPTHAWHVAFIVPQFTQPLAKKTKKLRQETWPRHADLGHFLWWLRGKKATPLQHIFLQLRVS